ncbi:MAG: HAD-IC family P-type ATPase [Bacilli bacterium]|nr:HAD-IC family P-type ATPase [Bacilli bacterium]MBN2876674.1 HAD-IC family P-type ATPase [Bacilli bacterium]
MAKQNYIPFGLDLETVNEQYAQGKYNQKRESNIRTNWQIISGNVFTYFNMILSLIEILLIMIQSYTNLWFMVVALINTSIAIVQEFRARAMIQSLSLITENTIMVVRQGLFVEVAVDKVVLGDLISYSAGKQVVTDGNIEFGELTVNESNITGESKSIVKTAGDSLYSGSFVISGKAFVKVSAVGKDNYIDTLQRQAKTLSKPQSVIVNTLGSILKVIGIIIIPLGLMTFFNVYQKSGYDYLPDFIADPASFELGVRKMAGSMVAMVPSGLVLLTTGTFAVSVVKLARKKTLVQELYSIETLARVDTLCLDKTGTITDGTMSVQGFEIQSGFSDKEYQEEDIYNLIASMNHALEDNNQTAKALKAFFGETVTHTAKKTVPFQSKNKYSLVSFKEGTYAIGAPEIIYRGQYSAIKPAVSEHAKEGKRVLLLAEVDGIRNDKFTGKARAVALILINDTVRESASKTIRDFTDQGVTVKVISGDNALTVSEVARRAGVPNADKYISMDTIKNKNLADIAREYTIFGRVTPEQKKALIEEIQKEDHKVCMIGDGVNDILALKQANVSVSMASGTDATRNISHMVLMDNDFETLPSVVREGRQIVCNLEKVSVLYLTKTLYTILLTFILLMTSRIYPFEPIQMFVIETFIVGIPTLVLALEPNNRMFKGKFFLNIMKNVVPGALFIIANLLAVYLFSDAFYGLVDAEISTIGIIAATFAYWLILVNASKPFNKMRLIMVIFAFLSAGIAFTFFRGLFQITTLSLPAVLYMMLLMETTYIGMKFYHNRFS